MNEDLEYLKAKIDAGADLIVTQLFFDVNLFLEYVRHCREYGIKVPILPGIVLIQSVASMKRIVEFNKHSVPQKLWDDLEAIKDDDAAVKEYGIQFAVDMIKIMIENGIHGFHFYTFNLERSTRVVLEKLGWIATQEKSKPLPWNPVSKNEKQNTCIFFFLDFFAPPRKNRTPPRIHTRSS